MTRKFICAEASCRRYDMAVDEDVAEALEYKCPACHAPLAEQESGLSPLEEQIMATYPSLIAVPFARLHKSGEVASKKDLLVATLQNLFKYLTMVVETEYLLGNYVSKELTEIIDTKLSSKPNLSAWPMFAASAIPTLEKQGHEFHINELPDYFRRMNQFKDNVPPKDDRVKPYEYQNEGGEFVKHDKNMGRFNVLINYRNIGVAHRHGEAEAVAQEAFQYYYQILLDCLKAMEWCTKYPLYKYEGGQVHHLMGGTPIIKGPIPSLREQGCNLYLGHPGDRPHLQLVPLFIVPRDYAPDSTADLFFFDQRINKTIRYDSPQGNAAYISGTLEHWKKLLRNKQVLWQLLGKTSLEDAEIRRRSSEVTGHSRNDLLQIGKVIKGLYYSRQEIEANLTGWPGSMPPLLALRSAAGGGKTCMMDHLAGQWQGEELPVLFIRAQGLEETDLLKLIQDRLRLEEKVTFADLAGALDQPLLILIDGLNEHAHPKDFLGSILAQAGQAKERAFKCFFTVRSENLDWVELDEEQKQLFQAEASTENATTKEEEKLPGPLLAPLDRLEVEAMWQEYGAKNPEKFKPRFSFEKAQQAKGTNVDAMDWMSRPLLLRLFLEVYHERDCPPVIGRYPLFTEYLKQLGQKTKDENGFLLNVGRICLEEESIVLDLDSLYADSRTQKIMEDSKWVNPFDRLIREGVLVELREGETRRIGFGVESFAEHVLGEVLLADGAADNPQGLAKVSQEKPDFPQIKRAVQVALQAKVEEEGREYLFEFINSPVKGVGQLAGGVLGQLILETGEAASIANDLMANPTLEDIKAANTGARYLEKELAYQSAVDFLVRVAELAAEPLADTEELASCFSWLAKALQTTGQYDQALEYYQKSLAIWLPQLGADHPDVAIGYNNIGTVHDRKGEHDQAVAYYQKSLDIWLKQLGADHPYLATSYNNIGLVHDSKGEYDQALEYHQKSLAIYLKQLGADHPLVAISYHNIGAVHNNKGEYDQALENYQKSLAIVLESLGADHPDVANSYHNIGEVHRAKGEYDQAVAYHQKALTIFSEQLGADHPDVATSYNGIGLMYDSKGDHDQALENYQKALAIRLKQLGSDHPDVAISYHNIGAVHRAKGEYDQALEYHQKSLAILLKKLGADHPLVATSYHHIGLVHDSKGEYDQAVAYYQKCLAIRLKQLGADHPKVAISYHNIGKVHRAKGEYDQALENYQKCLAIELKQLGSDHPKVAISYHNIGEVYEEKGEYDQALENYQKCLAIELKQLGSDHPDVAINYHNIGAVYGSKGNHDQALENYQKCLAIELKQLGAEHPDVATSYNNIGWVHSGKGDPDQAREYWEKALALYEGLGDEEMAQKLREKIANLESEQPND